MAHLKKSATTGRLLKSSEGHLVNGCREPYVLLPCFPIFVLEPCGGGAPICCRNDFREFAFSVESDGHLWAQDVLIVQGGTCYRVRYCEEADGCAGDPGIQAGLKIWAQPDHPSRVPANHPWQDGDCDYVEQYGPDCDHCPPKFAVGNHSCSGPGHGQCTMGMSWNEQDQTWEASIGYYSAGGSTPWGQDATFNVGLCPYLGPPPEGCDDLVLKITWHEAELDDWIESLNRPAGEKPTPPDCWYIFDGQTPYDRNVGIHGCILERRVAATLGEIITLDEPQNPGEFVPCYEVYAPSENPEPEEATVYRHLADCEACCE